MENAALAGSAFLPAEPIPGYLIKERIGVGGYGEVWKAEAPGGLMKAIKFVYGHLDEVRASREMKSLNRMKEVRHPFLLSLERIEIVDGHLIIVTELAETSLKDEFTRCRESGKAGISREPLLGYLRDAADALDYLFEQFSLQHLDVKPENLLLVGGRVKVADFGLLKDLHEASESLMGGLTPVYAPPEVFDGRPNRHSDQYSLAVLYQEMLTGERPFAGRTAAQLAAQHLHSEPALATLSPAQRPVVGRALAKDPTRRFASCREFVEALVTAAAQVQSQPTTANGYVPPVLVPDSSPASEGTIILSDALQGQTPALRGDSAAAPLPVEQLPPLELGGEPAVYRPTLIVGLGGTADRTLRRLKRRLLDRFGGDSLPPAVRMLLVDTDQRTISEAMKGEDRGRLSDTETLAIPLRASQEYRTQSKALLAWMSRRWIYNIPRSLQTEGLRPLGRLALVDHAARVTECLRAAVSSVVDQAGIAQSAEETGLPFQGAPPRVFLVASVAGGTGGAAVYDVAYLVKHLFAEQGIDDVELCSVLAHSTDRKASSRDLANANAFASLRELAYYNHPGGYYPGEAALGLSSHAPGASFGSTYLVHLGSDLNAQEFDEATDALAEYLYLGAVTPASAFFDLCRSGQAADPSGNGHFHLRTFGLCQIGATSTDMLTAAAELVSKTLVERWRGETHKLDDDRPVKLSEVSSVVVARDAATASLAAKIEREVIEHLDRLELDVDNLLKVVYSAIHHELGDESETYLRKAIQESLASYDARPEEARRRSLLAETQETIDAILGSNTSDRENQQQGFVSLAKALDVDLKSRAGNYATAICSWICEQVDTAPGRVKTAQHATERLIEHLRNLELSARETIGLLGGELQTFREAASDGRKAPREVKRTVIQQQLLQYAKVSLHEIALRGVSRIVRTVRGQVTALSDQLRDLWKDLNQLSKKFEVAGPLSDIHQRTQLEDLEERTLVESLWNARADLATELDRQLADDLAPAECRLRQILAENMDVCSTFNDRLRKKARSIVLRTVRDISGKDFLGDANSELHATERPLAERLKSAYPPLLECGGRERLLIVLPEHSDHEQFQQAIEQQFGRQATMIVEPDGDVVLCYEADGLPLERVAARLINNRSDYAKIAARLHTRVDVNWTTAW